MPATLDARAQRAFAGPITRGAPRVPKVRSTWADLDRRSWTWSPHFTANTPLALHMFSSFVVLMVYCFSGT
jgi:hypothetical protein